MDLFESHKVAITLAISDKIPYTIQEKVDGSLGIIYFYDKNWRVATRGSLNSEQAIRGAKILEKYNTQFFHQGFTYLAEIIYPENKIIVDYGDEEKLVLLAAFHNTTGKEVGPYHLSTVAHMLNMPCAEEYEYSIEEMIELQKTLPKDQEGFVVRFENGLRVKIKGNEYSRIAKIISHMSPLSFWEVMKNGLVDTLYLKQLPEEFRAEFEKIVNDLEMSYFRVMKEILLESDLLPSKDWSTHESRRGISIFIQQSNMKHKAAMFSVLNQDKNALNKYVMKLIRPTGNVIKGLE